MVVALLLYTDTFTAKVTAAHAVAAQTTAIITSIFLIIIMLCLYAQPPILLLTKVEVMLEGSTSIHQALSP